MDKDRRHNYTQKGLKQLAKERKEYARRQFLIPLKMSAHFGMLKNLGYEIIFDPWADGKCQFNAIGYFLRLCGFDYSANVKK